MGLELFRKKPCFMRVFRGCLPSKIALGGKKGADYKKLI